jgi:hypothetical protein
MSSNQVYICPKWVRKPFGFLESFGFLIEEIEWPCNLSTLLHFWEKREVLLRITLRGLKLQRCRFLISLPPYNYSLATSEWELNPIDRIYQENWVTGRSIGSRSKYVFKATRLMMSLHRKTLWAPNGPKEAHSGNVAAHFENSN